jgi:hypothetical protein
MAGTRSFTVKRLAETAYTHDADPQFTQSMPFGRLVRDPRFPDHLSANQLLDCQCPRAGLQELMAWLEPGSSP